VALVSDESALEACLQRCTIQIDDLYLLPLPCVVSEDGPMCPHGCGMNKGQGLCLCVTVSVG